MPFAVPTLPARALRKESASNPTTANEQTSDKGQSKESHEATSKSMAPPSGPVSTRVGAMPPPPLPTNATSEPTREKDTQEEPRKSASHNQTPKDRSAAIPNAPPLKYQKPSWSGYPNQQFSFEVIKNGVIVDRVEAPEKEFMVIGRLPMCDLEMEHPSLSRYHAVVQFKSNGECFIYDLNSSHGTKLNKARIPPNVHVPLKPGDQLRFGESTRICLFQTDQQIDQEEEERKMVAAMIEKQNRFKEQSRQEEFEERLNWRHLDAVNEDEDDEDMQDTGIRRPVDPDAYYHKDPKKALRNYLENRGFAYEFEIEEEGPGHAREYTARIRLPIETAMGPVYGQATTGKKKDAEREAALDACIQLDSRGLLNQTKSASSEGGQAQGRKHGHENSDEDDDEFYDRTGAQKKKAAKAPQKAETHESLTAKHQQLEKDMKALEQKIESYDEDEKARKQLEDSNDLDAYMASLDKQTKDSKAKMQHALAMMKKEEKRLLQLIEYTKPVDILSKIHSNVTATSHPAPPSSIQQSDKRDGDDNVTTEASAPKKPRILGPSQPRT
ncbi:Kanadaptin [Podila epigama]|nr:Kanadaptin [Podila epigama]